MLLTNLQSFHIKIRNVCTSDTLFSFVSKFYWSDSETRQCNVSDFLAEFSPVCKSIKQVLYSYIPDIFIIRFNARNHQLTNLPQSSFNPFAFW